jgi:hypothetical protein
LNGDKIVGLIGLAMALILIGRNGALWRLPLRKSLVLMAIWSLIIVAAAVTFEFLR